MISKFISSHAGIVLLSIIWGLALATFFKKSCESNDCRVIEFRGPTTKEASGFWNFGGSDCYRLKPVIVKCRK
jgi:hypothetical protein